MGDCSFRDLFRARPLDGVLNLAGYDPTWTPAAPSKSDAKDAVEGALAERLFDAHELLYASKERSVLLVLQGLDCSGKNGTIKHVVISMNPAGVRTASFKVPSEAEREQHFLQRYRERLPEPGQLAVFDRSHYEDVIVPLVHTDLDEDGIRHRIDEINDFERELHDRGTEMVKCLLHISFDEQRDRFLRRLRRDDKRWKFSEADVDTRRQWNEFQASYGMVAGMTSPDHAPWYVIPADHKWYRNWAIANLLIEVLDAMGLAYPQPELDIERLRARLESPN
ncbi:MAG: polyphosphate kinase 2 family protein [Ilumatobacteraceae bacterium]